MDYSAPPHDHDYVNPPPGTFVISTSSSEHGDDDSKYDAVQFSDDDEDSNTQEGSSCARNETTPISNQLSEPQVPIMYPTFGANLILPVGKTIDIYTWNSADLCNWASNVIQDQDVLQMTQRSILEGAYDGSIIACFLEDPTSTMPCFMVPHGLWLKLRNHAAVVYNHHCRQHYQRQKAAYDAQQNN